MVNTQVSSFLRYLEYERRYSAHTLAAYKNDIEQFAAFVNQYQIAPSDARHTQIRNWMVSLMQDGTTPRSINRKLSSLKSFYKFLLRKGDIAINPFAKITSPKTSKRLPVFIEKQNIEHLLTSLQFQKGFIGVRDKLIVELLYLTGMRRSELANLKDSDIDSWNSQLKVLGKGNKERLIPLHPRALQTIKGYIEERNKEFNDRGETLLVNKKGMPIKDTEIYGVVKRYLSAVTTIEKKSPHVLRHTFATHILNEGADINAVKELLGHANLAATQVYTHNTIEKLKNTHKQAHPRG